MDCFYKTGEDGIPVSDAETDTPRVQGYGEGSWKYLCELKILP